MKITGIVKWLFVILFVVALSPNAFASNGNYTDVYDSKIKTEIERDIKKSKAIKLKEINYKTLGKYGLSNTALHPENKICFDYVLKDFNLGDEYDSEYYVLENGKINLIKAYKADDNLIAKIINDDNNGPEIIALQIIEKTGLFSKKESLVFITADNTTDFEKLGKVTVLMCFFMDFLHGADSDITIETEDFRKAIESVLEENTSSESKVLNMVGVIFDILSALDENRVTSAGNWLRIIFDTYDDYGDSGNILVSFIKSFAEDYEPDSPDFGREEELLSALELISDISGLKAWSVTKNP